ncbi:MAG: methyltransferase domain-containing protein [Candidatus Izemoplasmatales bacterium]|nr:methyltransferase domain-containing protein [Candidatus Izemoplasmatales bacterium]
MIAKSYDLLMADVDYEKLLNFIEPYLKKEDFILDAGCGSGYLLVEFMSKGYHAIGVDLDSRMLSLAYDKLVALNFNPALYEHDLRLPFHVKVDVIVMMFDVLNYFKGIKKVIQEAKRALNPGGRLIFDVYKGSVLEDYDGYAESEEEPIAYVWKINRDKNRLIHQVMIDDDFEKVIQYVHPLAYYQEVLEEYGFTYEIKEGIDSRKYYIIAYV